MAFNLRNHSRRKEPSVTAEEFTFLIDPAAQPEAARCADAEQPQPTGCPTASGSSTEATREERTVIAKTPPWPPQSAAGSSHRGWRRLAGEGVGTFFLVLVAAGAPVADALSGGHVGRSAQVIAPGIMVLALIYTLGETSGAHLNPAVTLAFAARRDFPWPRVPGYVLAQLTGALAAAAVLRALFGRTAHLGISAPDTSVGSVTALITETILTLGLVTVVLGTVSGARNVGHNAAIAVGGYVALAGLWAGPLSGASMNPARSLAPALVDGHLGQVWIYLVGPVAGALLAVPLAWILRGAPAPQAAVAAQGVLALDLPRRTANRRTQPATSDN